MEVGTNCTGPCAHAPRAPSVLHELSSAPLALVEIGARATAARTCHLQSLGPAPFLGSMVRLPCVAMLALAVPACSRAHADDVHGGHAASDAAHGAAHEPASAPGAKGSAHGHAPASAHAAPHVANAADHGGGHGGSGHGGSHGGSAHGEGKRGGYVVPFTWDTSEDEPLARMRGFMRGVVADNARYVADKKPDFFKAVANGQKPRATVVACSDSRVQSTAFDATPENDVFTIRNIGNQILTSEGSVEYGVHHLKTSVLMVLGHAGCGAVKASLGDFSKESGPISRELASLQFPKPAAGTAPDVALTQGVVANVHAQVSLALLKFGEEVEHGDLTVVGAVYDFRNDLGHGFGRVSVVNVNGQSDKERIDAFVRAMSGGAEVKAKRLGP